MQLLPSFAHLHDECTVLVGVLSQGVQVRNGFVERLHR